MSSDCWMTLNPASLLSVEGGTSSPSCLEHLIMKFETHFAQLSVHHTWKENPFMIRYHLEKRMLFGFNTMALTSTAS